MTWLSTTATSSTCSVAVFRFLLMVSAPSGIWTVQNSPLSAMSPLKSWTCSPELGSKRSIHMRANVPDRTVPSSETYVPWNTRISVANVYELPSASVAVPLMYARPVKPSKSVMTLGSTFSPINPNSTGPGRNTWMNGPSGTWIPPGIGFGSEPAAVAVLGSSNAIVVTRPTMTEMANRRFIDTPSPFDGRRRLSLDRGSLTPTRFDVKARSVPAADSAGDTKAPQTVATEHDVAHPGQRVDHEVRGDQWPCPAPPRERVTEGESQNEIPGEATPSLVEVVTAAKERAAAHGRGGWPPQLLQAADQIPDRHDFLEEAALQRPQGEHRHGPPVPERRYGHHEPVDVQRDGPEVDAEADRGHAQRAEAPPRHVWGESCGPQPERLQPLTAPPGEVDHQPHRGECEHDTGELTGQLDVGEKRDRDAAVHRRL